MKFGLDSNKCSRESGIIRNFVQPELKLKIETQGENSGDDILWMEFSHFLVTDWDIYMNRKQVMGLPV